MHDANAIYINSELLSNYFNNYVAREHTIKWTI